MHITPTQRAIENKKFVKAYLEHGGNATQAALQMKPYTYHSARQKGTQMLRRPEVLEAIREALEDLHIDYRYVLKSRKGFVDTAVRQLQGMKNDKEPFVSPSDAHKHLQGIETILERTECRDFTSSNLHVHIDLSNLSHKELLQKHQEASQWFSSIIDGEEVKDLQIEHQDPQEDQ